MPPSRQWVFGPFRFDPANACLWHGTQALPLMPITCALLECLVAQAGQLVTKDALLEAVWPATAVSDAVLKVRISELRKLLGDTAKVPQYITTVHRRGYRFMAPVTLADPSALLGAAPSPPPPRATHLVGREPALAQLHHYLARAYQGDRQVVFVTGEAGIGKTALVEAWLTQVRAAPHLWVAHGQCVEHYGVGEAYLPMLEALGRLCRTPARARVLPLLRHRAPLWLVQLPWLLSAAERDELQRVLWGTTRERMLREMAEALEALTAEQPLVLVFEDLHWSDYATLDLLAVLARRQEP
ncbi:MAG: AAA family ATPase, partial [Acidobacteria bacterium]|nr:AAA family ATPase [Acidobacteriota bacterium]